MLKNGILIIATGSPYYGRMAYNLAVTIRRVSSMPIAVVHSGAALNHLSEKQRSMFTELIEAKEEAFKAKLDIFELTPFTNTLYLDADMAWLPEKTPEELFEKMKGRAFQCITEGYYDYKTSEDKSSTAYYFWCDPIVARDVYRLENTLPKTRSEVIYFEKGARKIFADAKKVYNNPKLNYKEFVKGVPDELAFNIALAKNNIQLENWQPSYWFGLSRKHISLSGLYNSFYLLSAGGHGADGTTKSLYNRVVAAACGKLGVQHLFPLVAKSSVMKERINNA